MRQASEGDRQTPTGDEAGVARPRDRARAALSAVAALLLLSAGAGCGSDATASAPHVELRIQIAASARAGAPVRAWRLRCEPLGGDWPRRAVACDRITASALAPIARERRDRVPLTAQPVDVRGTAFGRPVELAFDAYGSSTRRDRLRQLERTLGRQAFAEARRRSR